MPWPEWIDVNTLRILSRHLSGVIGTIAVFMVVYFLIEWAWPEGILKTILETIDSFVVVALFIWLAYQMAYLLWMRRVRNGP